MRILCAACAGCSAAWLQRVDMRNLLRRSCAQTLFAPCLHSTTASWAEFEMGVLLPRRVGGFSSHFKFRTFFQKIGPGAACPQPPAPSRKQGVATPPPRRRAVGRRNSQTWCSRSGRCGVRHITTGTILPGTSSGGHTESRVVSLAVTNKVNYDRMLFRSQVSKKIYIYIRRPMTWEGDRLGRILFDRFPKKNWLKKNGYFKLVKFVIVTHQKWVKVEVQKDLSLWAGMVFSIF